MAAISTLTGNFSDAAWELNTGGGTDWAFSGHRLTCTISATGSYTETAGGWDLTGSSYTWKQEEIPGAYTGMYEFRDNGGSTNWYRIRCNSSTNHVWSFEKNGSVVGSTWTDAYARSHPWVRIREASGTTYCEVSTDGSSWAQPDGTQNTTNIATITNIYVRLQCNTDLPGTYSCQQVNGYTAPTNVVMTQATTAVDSAGSWTSTTNTTALDTSNATVTGTNGNEYPIHLGGFDFSGIPTGSTINSVKAWCVAKVNNVSYGQWYMGAFDGATQLALGSLAAYTQTADYPFSISLTPTLAQLKSTDFYVRWVHKRISSSSTTGSLNFVFVSVDYTPADALTETKNEPLGAKDTSGLRNVYIDPRQTTLITGSDPGEWEANSFFGEFSTDVTISHESSAPGTPPYGTTATKFVQNAPSTAPNPDSLVLLRPPVDCQYKAWHQSYYIYVPSGSADVSCHAAWFSDGDIQTEVTQKNTWVRVGANFIQDNTNLGIALFAQSPGAGSTYYVTCVIECLITLDQLTIPWDRIEYFDGSTSGGSWEGTANASPSNLWAWENQPLGPLDNLGLRSWAGPRNLITNPRQSTLITGSVPNGWIYNDFFNSFSTDGTISLDSSLPEAPPYGTTATKFVQNQPPQSPLVDSFVTLYWSAEHYQYKAYHHSLYVYVPTGSANIEVSTHCFSDGHLSQAVNTKDEWVRVSANHILTSTWAGIGIVAKAPGAGSEFYVTNILEMPIELDQIPISTSRIEYFDGSLAGCDWESTTDLSISSRWAWLNAPEGPEDNLGLTDQLTILRERVETKNEPLGLDDTTTIVHVQSSTYTDALGLDDTSTVSKGIAVTPSSNALGLADSNRTIAKGIGVTPTSNALGLDDTTTIVHTQAVPSTNAEGLADSATIAKGVMVIPTPNALGLDDTATVDKGIMVIPTPNALGLADSAIVDLVAGPENIEVPGSEALGMTDLAVVDHFVDWWMEFIGSVGV